MQEPLLQVSVSNAATIKSLSMLNRRRRKRVITNTTLVCASIDGEVTFTALAMSFVGFKR